MGWKRASEVDQALCLPIVSAELCSIEICDID